MMKPVINYYGLLGLLQTYEKDHQLHKKKVNIVGASSSDGHRPFKKGKKKKKKKVPSAVGQTMKSKSKLDQSQVEFLILLI